MTYSHHTKLLNQISQKSGKVSRYTKYNVPKQRKFGENTRRCRRCMRTGAHISKYGLNLCRQCFRDISTKIGFKKFN